MESPVSLFERIRLERRNVVNNREHRLGRMATSSGSRRLTLARAQHGDPDAESVIVAEDGRDVLVEWHRGSKTWLWTPTIREATVVLFASNTAAVMRRFRHLGEEPHLDEEELLARSRRRHIDIANVFASKYSLFGEVGEKHFVFPQGHDPREYPRIIVVGLQDEQSQQQPPRTASSGRRGGEDGTQVQPQPRTQWPPRYKYAEALCEILAMHFPRVLIERLYYQAIENVMDPRLLDLNYASLEIVGGLPVRHEDYITTPVVYFNGRLIEVDPEAVKKILENGTEDSATSETLEP